MKSNEMNFVVKHEKEIVLLISEACTAEMFEVKLSMESL